MKIPLDFRPLPKLLMPLNLLLSAVLLSISIVTYSQNRVVLSVHTGLGYSWFSGKGASRETDYHTEYLVDKGGCGKSECVTGYDGGVPKSNDLRVTDTITASLKKWSLDFCYKHGLRSYSDDNDAKAFSNFLQVSLAYRILPWKLK